MILWQNGIMVWWYDDRMVWWHDGLMVWWHDGMMVWWYVWWHDHMIGWYDGMVYGGMMVWWYLELVVRAASFRQLHVFILVDSRLRNYNIPGRRIHSTTGARSIWKNISSFSMFPHDSQPLRWTIDIYSLAAYMKCLWWHEFVSSINYEY